MEKENKIDKESFPVRKYRSTDYEKVAQLWSLTGMGNPARGDDNNTILRSISLGGALLVMTYGTDASVIGTSWMTFDGRRIHLHHFGIHPDWQGKGLSHILLRESLRFVKEKGYQVKLEVHDTNLRAINLYKKHGFEYLGDYDVYIIRDLSKI